MEVVKEEIGEKVYVSKNSEIRNFYDSWGELDSEVKSKIVVPEYIPSGYELYGIDYYDLDNRKKIKADYYNKENKHLVISITLWEDNSDQYREIAMDEETYMLLSEYSDENTLYYKYEDEYICMVSVGKGFYRISGNIALEEMVKVREGLGNIKK